jgi:ABC-2 type transport system ATP-binding protein
MAGNTIIETHGLTKEYGSVTAVDKLSMCIEEGEVFGLLGPNGAGKTTTTLMLLGLAEPTCGTASIAGWDCTREPIEVKKITGYLPDNMGFYPEMTGRENLRFTGRVNGLGEKEIEERMDALLDRVHMAGSADKKVGTYSRGMKQRLGIADILMKDPKVIIMDEPTLGIDPEGMRELTALIKDLSVKDGRTILISSHQLYQVQQICDRVGIFVKGSLIACGRIEDLGKQLENEGGFLLELSAEPFDGRLAELLRGIDGVKDVTKGGEDIFMIRSASDIRAAAVRALLDGGYRLLHLRERGSDLDEIYRRYFEKAGENSEGDKYGTDNKTKRKNFKLPFAIPIRRKA